MYPSLRRLTIATAFPLALAACGTTMSDRATGGAAAGAAVGAVALGIPTFGIGFIPGAILGGVIGAGVGAGTSPNTVDLGAPPWSGSRYR